MASPHLDTIPDDPNTIILPAVNGTRAVLEAAIKNKVRKIVITSALSTIFVGVPAPKNSFDESDWGVLEKMPPYD